MNYFISMYGNFHTDKEFHKKISKTTYSVLMEIEPDALENFLHYDSGHGRKEKLELAMKIVYNLLEKEIKEFYGYNIDRYNFLRKVVIEDEFSD